jgi:hypothetical protein
MNNLADALLGDIDSEISFARSLIGVINAGETLDLTSASSLVNTFSISAFALFEGGGNMDPEKLIVSQRTISANLFIRKTANTYK